MSGQHRHGHEHLSARTREDIIHMVEHEHASQSAAARRFGVTHQAVSKILKHYHQTGDTIEQHSGGAQREYSENDMQILSTLLDEYDTATSQVILELMPAGTPQVTDRTIRRYRRELGFTPRKTRPHVIDTAAQIAARQAWARQHRAVDPNRYVFMDESTMVLRHTGGLVWVRRGRTTPSHEITDLKAAVHEWGAIWNQGAVFAQHRGRLNANAYEKILDDNIGRFKRQMGPRLILHDRATFHRTKNVTKWFEDHHLTAELLPAHTPHFNAIEYAWSWIKRCVRAQKPQTAADLEAAMEEACQSLPEATRLAFINHAWHNILAEAH